MVQGGSVLTLFNVVSVNFLYHYNSRVFHNFLNRTNFLGNSNTQ